MKVVAYKNYFIPKLIFKWQTALRSLASEFLSLFIALAFGQDQCATQMNEHGRSLGFATMLLLYSTIILKL